MNRIILFLLLFSVSKVNGQLPNEFTIGDFIEVSSDTVKIYFDGEGKISSAQCARYYRLGTMHPTQPAIDGAFKDFYLDGQLKMHSAFQDGLLHGPVRYYYPGGVAMAEGQYTTGMRSGRWTFFYSSGQTEKIVNYHNGLPYILQAYDEEGKQMVEAGNGMLTTKFNLYPLIENIYIANGKIEKGKISGRWTYKNIKSDEVIGYEDFDGGNFLLGESRNFTYSDYARIGTEIYYADEFAKWFDNINAQCRMTSLATPRYRGVSPFNGYFAKVEKDFSKKAIAFANQWFIVGLAISKKNILRTINVASSLNDQVAEGTLYSILKDMKSWQSAIVNSKHKDTYISYVLVLQNGKAVVPSQLRFDQFKKEAGLK